jgi:hypothetical protein
MGETYPYGSDTRRSEQAHERVVVHGAHFLRGIEHLADGHLHVVLAAAQPHIAKVHVFEDCLAC